MTNSNRRAAINKRTYDVLKTSKNGPHFSEILNMSDRITIRVDGTMKRIIENIATTERKSASQIIRDALYDYFEDFEARG